MGRDGGWGREVRNDGWMGLVVFTYSERLCSLTTTVFQVPIDGYQSFSRQFFFSTLLIHHQNHKIYS